MSGHWGLLADFLVAGGTFALALTAFVQVRHSLRSQKARAKATLADKVYIPVRMELETICGAEHNQWVGSVWGGSPHFGEWLRIKHNQPILIIQIPEGIRERFDSVAVAVEKHHQYVQEYYQVAMPLFASLLGKDPRTWDSQAGLNVRFAPHATLGTSISPRDVLAEALQGNGLTSFLNKFEHQYPQSDLEYQIHEQQEVIAGGEASLKLMGEVFLELGRLPQLKRCLDSAKNLARNAAAAHERLQSELVIVARLVERHHS